MSDSDTEVIESSTEEPPDNADLPGRLESAAPRRWRNRATPALFGVFLLAGGFLGGVLVQKHWGKTTTTATTTTAATSRGASGFSGQMPGAGASGAPGGFGGPGGGTATTGILKTITTTALVIQTAAGKTVTVTIADSTKVQQTVTLAKLKAGQALTIQGSTGTDGAITATSVTAS
jgi:hypothetical protein